MCIVRGLSYPFFQVRTYILGGFEDIKKLNFLRIASTMLIEIKQVGNWGPRIVGTLHCNYSDDPLLGEHLRRAGRCRAGHPCRRHQGQDDEPASRRQGSGALLQVG